jgi:hypothetical protein
VGRRVGWIRWRRWGGTVGETRTLLSLSLVKEEGGMKGKKGGGRGTKGGISGDEDGEEAKQESEVTMGERKSVSSISW